MASSDGDELRDLVERLLRNARAELSTAERTTEVCQLLEVAENYIEQNEFKLALATLVKVGERASPTPMFWSSLEQAARRMGLKRRAIDLQLKWIEEASRGLTQEVQNDNDQIERHD